MAVGERRGVSLLTLSSLRGVRLLSLGAAGMSELGRLVGRRYFVREDEIAFHCWP